ncbi:myeloid leukemia factor 2-like [Centruroides vittatus]|uniref:myeloid leukemia factor 2-like n=1 Tax=Centruroides vittatus TaxID=120091 RepID=UPI0035107970
MSLFRSMMRDFDNDPFFRGPMESMRQMESMMDAMMSPFGGMFGEIPQLDYGNGVSRQNRNSLMPFGFGHSLFPSMNSMFSNFDRLSQDPNCHSYSSSSVMTFTTDEHGRPQVYQASSSKRTGPGGVSETRRSVQDTRTGVQKMAIGHHLQDRGHVIEKSRNRFTGEEDECQEYINIEEEEAEAFNREWEDRAQVYRSRHAAINGSSQWRERSPGLRREPLAITAGPANVVESPEPSPESPKMKIPSSESKSKRKHGSSSKSRSRHRSQSKPRHETSM